MKFQTMQEILKFNCICKICKNGKAVDKADFDEYDKIMQDHKNLLRDYNLSLVSTQTICMQFVDGQKKAFSHSNSSKTTGQKNPLQVTSDLQRVFPPGHSYCDLTSFSIL